MDDIRSHWMTAIQFIDLKNLRDGKNHDDTKRALRIETALILFLVVYLFVGLFEVGSLALPVSSRCKLACVFAYTERSEPASTSSLLSETVFLN